MAAKSAPILPPTTAAVAVMVVCVVVIAAASLAAAAPVSGDGGGITAVGLPLLMAARGGGGGRVGDSEPVEMDSEAHRRVVLALRGGGSSPSQRTGDPNKPWCDRTCPGKPGDPYLPDPRGCLKIYRCPGATSANGISY